MISTIYKITIPKLIGDGNEGLGFIFSGKPKNIDEVRGKIRWDNLVSALQTIGFITFDRISHNHSGTQFYAIVDRGVGSLAGWVDDVEVVGAELIEALVIQSLSAPSKTYSGSLVGSLVPALSQTKEITVGNLFDRSSAAPAVTVVPIYGAGAVYVGPEETIDDGDGEGDGDGDENQPMLGLPGKPDTLVYDSLLEGEVTLGSIFPDVTSHVLPVGQTVREIPNVSSMLGQIFSYNPSIVDFEYTNLWIESQFHMIPSHPTDGIFFYDRAADTVRFTVPETYGAAFGAKVHGLVNVTYADGRTAVILQQIMAYGVGMPEEFVEYAQFINILPVEDSGFTMIGEDGDFPLYNEYIYSVHMFDEDHEFVVNQPSGPFQFDLAANQRYSFDNGGLPYSFSVDIPLAGAQLSPQGFITGDYVGSARETVEGTVTITLGDHTFRYPIKYTLV